MKQNYISKTSTLLYKGKLMERGYSTHMVFVYDRNDAKKRHLKEWDFYQIQCGNKVLQVTIGHISYCAQISANILDLDNGKKISVSHTLFKCRKLKSKMPTNPEKPNTIQWFSKKLKVQFEVTSNYRRLTLTKSGKRGIDAEVDVTLTNSAFSKEKMVIATPFAKPTQWYLNYKENCFVANGYARIGNTQMVITNGNGLLDWGRGVWPRKHKWVWGNGSTIVDGKHFGFNIGWGFGDTSNATENMFFWEGKAYKLGEVQEIRNGDSFRYIDKEHKFVFDVDLIADNYTRTKVPGMVNNTCHQVFGTWKGEVTLPDGTTLQIPPFVAFCEHADNNW